MSFGTCFHNGKHFLDVSELLLHSQIELFAKVGDHIAILGKTITNANSRGIHVNNDMLGEI